MSVIDDDEVSVSSLISNEEENIDKKIDEELDENNPDDEEENIIKEEKEDESDNESDNEIDNEIEDLEEKEANRVDIGYDEEYKEEYDEDDDSDSDDENYLQRLDELNKTDIIGHYHPELMQHNNDEIEMLCKITYNEKGIIVDPLHKTLPFITKYERARILGERSKQINMGAKPLVEIEPDVIDGYLIALKEYNEKKIPFIVKRPLPNGGCEYWKFKDLEII